MTSKELNLKLINTFPEIKDIYCKETSWQDGDETGSHIVYEDIFVPFIIKNFVKKNDAVLKKVFKYIEELLNSKDEYAVEVVCLSVIESLVFNQDVSISSVIPFMSDTTVLATNEIIKNYK